MSFYKRKRVSFWAIRKVIWRNSQSWGNQGRCGQSSTSGWGAISRLRYRLQVLQAVCHKHRRLCAFGWWFRQLCQQNGDQRLVRFCQNTRKTKLQALIIRDLDLCRLPWITSHRWRCYYWKQWSQLFSRLISKASTYPSCLMAKRPCQETFMSRRP